MSIDKVCNGSIQWVTLVVIGIILGIMMTIMPSDVLADPMSGTNTIISNTKTIFKNLAGFLIILLGAFIFLAAVFWVSQSISGWMSKRLEMGEALLRVFVAIIGVMIMVWFLTEAKTKVDAISGIIPIEVISRIA